MQRIEIAAKFIDDVKSGRKKTAVRSGHSLYVYGEAAVVCADPVFGQTVQIIQTNECDILSVYRHEFLEEGVATQDELLALLQQSDPTLTMRSPVTVVRWK